MAGKENNLTAYPPIHDLLNPFWKPDPKRLIVPSVDDLILKSNALGSKPPHQFTPQALANFNEGFLLDVGCGINFGVYNSLVDFLPNAYGIDPGLLENSMPLMRHGRPPKDSVIGGYAEDMPFEDKQFRTTVSLKCVGWYPNETVNPFWAVSEMVRVTEDGGLILIHIGQVFGNERIIMEAAKRVKNGPMGKRIQDIYDYSSKPASLITIQLAA